MVLLRRGGRQDARARHVGGGQGDGGGYRAPSGGRFAGRAPGRFQYSYGPRDRGFGGGTMHHAFLAMVVVSLAVDGTGDTFCQSFANPSVEQMARHWFASHFANPSIETFAHPFVSLLMCSLEAWRTGGSWTPVVCAT